MSFPFTRVKTCGTQTDDRTVYVVQETDTPTLNVYDNIHAARAAVNMLDRHATLREMYVNHAPLYVVKPHPMEKMKSTILPCGPP